MEKALGIAALVAGALLAFGHAQPITKSGACPPFTRSATPDNWNSKAWQAKPTSEFDRNTIQDPLDPDQSANCIEVPEGLKLELWASEKQPGGITPGIAYLQHFTFDERGRLWGVEPRSYPNLIRNSTNSVTDPKFTGGDDRIVILEDTDGDRVMDKAKVFRDGLNLPQGIEVVKGGVVVAMAPYLVFFPNNNDVAGTPQILWSGLGTSLGSTSWDTHFGISNLMYGLDNWIYGHTGAGLCNAGGIDCGQGKVWRFRHRSLGHAADKFEIWTNGFANAWGVGQMEDGQIFQSAATPPNGHIYHSIRKNTTAFDIRTANGSNDRGVVYPITGDRWLWEGSTGKDPNGNFTSATTSVSGMQFYTSRLFPRKYWNRFAFACDGANKLCNQDSLVPSGSTWRAVRLPGPQRSNIIASKDAWVAPILAKTGPDGAVWVLDWYNYLYLHNPASPPGDGKAWLNALRTKTRYRIWRVTPADGAREPILNLANAPVTQLVDAFANPNFHWRLQAQRLLIDKGWSAELGALLQDILANDRSVDDLGNNPRVVHALWTLSGLGRFESDAATWNPILRRLLIHPAWGVRRNVLMAMPRTTASAQAIGDRCMVNDGHGHVRLQALVALSEITSKPAGLPALSAAYQNTDSHSQSAFSASGITSAATQPCAPVLDTATPTALRATAQARSDLRISVSPDGLRLQSHGQLPDGAITVADLRGRAIFRSGYIARETRWTNPSLRGLESQVYLYTFRGVDGTLIKGRLTPAGSL